MAAAVRGPLTDTDLLAFTFVGDVQLSPDGRRVAYTRTHIDRQDNQYRSRIETVAADGSAPPRPLTAGPRRDSQPRFSPDGRYLAFVSDRDADRRPRRSGARAPAPADGDEGRGRLGPQIYVLALAGGEARRITDIAGGVGELAWSPDSRRLAFVHRSRPGGAEFFGREAAAGDDADALYARHNRDVRYITRAHYRMDGFGWYEDRRAHVFVVDVAAALAAGEDALPRPLQVTSGAFDHQGPAWSPDGRLLAVSACRQPDADMVRGSDIWLFPADGSAAGGPGFAAAPGGAPGGGPGDPAPAAPASAPTSAPVRLTTGSGMFGAAAFSPDGRRLACFGHERPLKNYSDARVWVIDVGAGPDGAPVAGESRCLTAAHPRSFGDRSLSDTRTPGGDAGPVWSADGAFIYALASDRGTTHLYRVASEGGDVRRLTSGDFVAYGAAVSPTGGRAALVVARPEAPCDIYAADLPGAAVAGIPALDDPTATGGLTLRRLTRCNEELLAGREISLPERFTCRAAGGPEVQGWAWRPLGWQPGRSYPAVLEIHGGPMAMYSGTFFMEFQLLCAAGMGVIITNPRGSQGYGQDFCAGIAGDWGNNDYADIMAGVDAALARLPWVDAGRLGVAGGSYGGYMTSWIIGHTQRFKAACVMRPVTNCYSFFGSSDGGYRWDEVWGAGQAPWDNPEDYMRQSPIRYAAQMRTPTLIVHSEQDYRCLIEQGEQLYAALRKQGVEAAFLRYPGESHGLSRGGKPWHRVHRLRHIVAWFASHLGAGGAQATAAD